MTANNDNVRQAAPAHAGDSKREPAQDRTILSRHRIPHRQRTNSPAPSPDIARIVPPARPAKAVAAHYRSQIPCFTPGTMILTPTGRRPVETLQIGDQVWTDSGPKRIRWTGSRTVSNLMDRANRHVRPIRIEPGAIGGGKGYMPLIVSPDHRMIVRSADLTRSLGLSRALVAADHLSGRKGIAIDAAPSVTYHHIMCDAHAILEANGFLTESFFPSDVILGEPKNALGSELLALFPHLGAFGGSGYGPLAAPDLTAREAKLFVH